MLPAFRVDDLLIPDGPQWTPGRLRELTATVATRNLADLLGILRFASPNRWWARLALTDDVELWLLSWLPGQGTAPHDHGGACGAFTVLLGELAESYRDPGGPVRQHRYTAGLAVGFGGGRVHQVRNHGPARAASVHAYSPPLIPTRRYTDLLTLEPVRT